MLNVPKPTKLPNSDRVLPFVFIGDNAFGLKTNMMKPYPSQNLPLDQRVFNYRLSRARRVIENAFGIAASRFRVFHRAIIAKPSTVTSITKALVALHNFLISLKPDDDSYSYCPVNFADRDGPNGYTAGEWRKEKENILGLRDINHLGSNSYCKNAKETRDLFKEYFNGEGEVDWQWDIVNKTD